MPLNAPITQIKGRGIKNYVSRGTVVEDARGDYGQITEVRKSANGDKWMASVKRPSGASTIFEIPASRALDEGAVRTEVEKLMAADTRDDTKEGPTLEDCVAEMDGLIGAVREVKNKVDAMEAKKDAR